MANALVDYSFTQYKKDTDAGGFVTKYQALRQFFPRAGGANIPVETNFFQPMGAGRPEA